MSSLTPFFVIHWQAKFFLLFLSLSRVHSINPSIGYPFRFFFFFLIIGDYKSYYLFLLFCPVTTCFFYTLLHLHALLPLFTISFCYALFPFPGWPWDSLHVSRHPGRGASLLPENPVSLFFHCTFHTGLKWLMFSFTRI